MPAENPVVKEEGGLTVMAVEFVGYQRFFSIYRHTCALKLRVYHDIIASCVAEHGGKILKLVNEGVTAYFTDPREALKSAIRMKTALQRHNGPPRERDQITFAVFLHHGRGAVEGKEVGGSLIRALTTMTDMSGRQDLIYATDGIVAETKGTRGIEFFRAGSTGDSLNRYIEVYEVRWGDDTELEACGSITETQFQYRRALVEGVGETCFYCGSSRHSSSACPSKHLPEQTHSFDKLRRLSVKQLNTLFFETLSRGLDNVHHEWEQDGEITDAYFAAYHGFYDLKRVFQLRFGRVIMSYGGNDWGKAAGMNAESDGGRIWLALDHLRTGDLPRAEVLLKELHDENPQGFRTNLAMGYLSIEQDRHMHALDYLESAYKFAVTRPQKILALLLACRVHYIYLNNTEASKEQIRLIKKIDGYCPEALYQDITLQMRSDGDATAIRRLVGLIRSYPEYYLTALIDPDLAAVQTTVNEELHSMLDSIQEQARVSLEESENRVKHMESWLGEDEPKVRDLREMLAGVKAEYDSGSFYGCFDAAFKSSSVVTECGELESHSRAAMKSLVGELRDRLHPLLAYFRERGETGPHIMGVEIHDEIVGFQEHLKSSFSYGDAIARHKEISERLRRVEEIVEAIEKRKALARRFTGFLKKTILFFFMITFAGVALMVAGRYASPEGISLLTVMFDHRGSVLFASCIVSIIAAAAAECYSFCRKQGSSVPPD